MRSTTEVGTGLSILRTYAAQQRQALGQRQLADEVKVHAAVAGIAAQDAIVSRDAE
jgi:hypothetical protein